MNNQGTTILVDPNGKKYAFPTANVGKALAAGFKQVSSQATQQQSVPNVQATGTNKGLVNWLNKPMTGEGGQIASDVVGGIHNVADLVPDSVLNALPSVFGTIAGYGGSLAGGTPGSIAMSGIGGAAGSDVEDIGKFLKGEQSYNPTQVNKDAVNNAAIQAPFGAFGPTSEATGNILKAVGVPRFIGEAVGRYGEGTVLGTASALAQGQKFPQALSTGNEVGQTNTVLPWLTKLGGKIAGFGSGTSKGIMDKIATAYVGDPLSRDPSIRANLDYRDPIASVQKLQQAAQTAYQPLNDALTKVKGNLGSFVDAVRSGLQKGSDSSEVVDRKVNAMVLTMARQAGGDAAVIGEEISRLTTQAGRPTMSTGSMARATASAVQDKIDNLYAKLYDMDLPGTVFNGAKQEIDQSVNKLAYKNAKEYVEKIADPILGTGKTAEINGTYDKFRSAVNEINDNYVNKHEKPNVGGNSLMNMGKRIAIGAPFALAGSALSGGGTASIFTNPFAITALLGYMASAGLQNNPETAVPYANALNVGEKVIPKALQSLGVRLPGMLSGQ